MPQECLLRFASTTMSLALARSVSHIPLRHNALDALVTTQWSLTSDYPAALRGPRDGCLQGRARGFLRSDRRTLLRSTGVHYALMAVIRGHRRFGCCGCGQGGGGGGTEVDFRFTHY